jgi:hypothetical protein
MAPKTLPGGTFTMAEDLTVTRFGYGAMQLAGPGVFGPPSDRNAAVAVLREAVELGITHIDTSDFYGPYVTNEIIKEALYPYSYSLHIVTKVGALRDADGGWPHARSPEQLRQAVLDNLDHLGLDVLEVVNLRVGGFDRPEPDSIAEPFTALAQLQQEGLINHLGLSTVNAEQIAEAQSIAPDCVRAKLLQPRPPERRRPDRRAGRSGHCLRALLPARRLFPAAIRHVGISGHPPRVNTNGRRAGMPAPALAEHPAHPGHVVRSALARQRDRCGADPLRERPGRAECDCFVGSTTTTSGSTLKKRPQA